MKTAAPARRIAGARAKIAAPTRIAKPATTRNRMNARPWFEPVFGAHLLGQIEKSRVSRETAHRAYLQPESRTPLRPDHETRA